VALGARAWTALALVYVVWGSTYLGMDVGAESMPPFLLLAGRFAVAGAILYAIAARGAARPSRREWVAQGLVGTALLGVGTGAVGWAVTRIDTGTAALIVATVPLWLSLFDRVLSGARLSLLAVIGLVVGFVGVGILVGPGMEGSAVAGVTLVFTSAVWAAGTLGARSAPRPRDPFLTAAMQMLAGSVACLLFGTVFGEWGDVTTPTTRSLIALGYLIVFGSLVAFSAYVWLLSSVSMSVVGTYAYVNPVVAVVLGALFLDERLSGTTAVAGVAIVVAVALIVSARPVEAPAQSAAIPARAR
jgi:drug/metabolite transporter (DMT)-like permease